MDAMQIFLIIAEGCGVAGRPVWLETVPWLEGPRSTPVQVQDSDWTLYLLQLVRQADPAKCIEMLFMYIIN